MLLAVSVVCAAIAACAPEPGRVLTISGSMLGREGEVLRRQLDRFRERHPQIAVALRATPDAADLRHQLYVQWLNAHVSEPDVLQLDVVWTPEFAAAGWIAPLDPFSPPTGVLFPASVDAHRWNGRLFALPWFVDVGMLYWRTDLVAEAPRTFDELVRAAGAASGSGARFGFVWQGARYEGLVVNFVEHLGAFGGRILDEDGRVTVDEPAAVDALTFMRDQIRRDGVVPPAIALVPNIAIESQRALDRVLARCAADADCNARFPAISAQFAKLDARLAAAPVAVTLADPVTGESGPLDVTHAHLVTMARMLTYSPGAASILGAAIDLDRAPDTVATVAGDDVLLVVCAEPPTATARGAEFGISLLRSDE